MVIIHLVTCEGKFSVFKSCHLRLLAHFVDNRCLNFPLVFLRSLEKMSNLVCKNTLHPKSILYHHSFIKILILDQLKERNQPWETFVFKVLNRHLNIYKRSHHFHYGTSQTSPIEEENPNIVHLGEDISEPNSSTPNKPASPVSSKFVPFSWPRTRKQKEKNDQCML